MTDGPRHEFDVIFKTDGTYEDRIDGGTVHYMSFNYSNSSNNGCLVWNESSGAIADNSGTYAVKITLAEYEGEIEYDDELALKSEIADLSEYRN